MKLISVTRTPNHSKAFKAVFMIDGNTRIVRFGTGSNYVLNQSKKPTDRAAYIARHRVNENWTDPTTPGALSRYILWGDSRNLGRNITAFKRKFKL